jgi:hypothetical protein
MPASEFGSPNRLVACLAERARGDAIGRSGANVDFGPAREMPIPQAHALPTVVVRRPAAG